MSTPRTNANCWRECLSKNSEVVQADFARTLETELAAALEREKGLRVALRETLNTLNYADTTYTSWSIERELELRALCTEGKTNTPAAYP